MHFSIHSVKKYILRSALYVSAYFLFTFRHSKYVSISAIYTSQPYSLHDKRIPDYYKYDQSRGFTFAYPISDCEYEVNTCSDIRTYTVDRQSNSRSCDFYHRHPSLLGRYFNLTVVTRWQNLDHRIIGLAYRDLNLRADPITPVLSGLLSNYMAVYYERYLKFLYCESKLETDFQGRLHDFFSPDQIITGLCDRTTRVTCCLISTP